MRTQAGKEVHCAALCACACEGDWSSVNVPIWTPHSCLSVFFFFSFCKSLTPSRSPSFSPAACSFHRRAGSEFPSSRHNRWSSLDGASMRCHKFWKPCSLGFYIWIAMLFRGRFGAKLFFPSSLYRWSNEGYRLENDFCFWFFFEEDGNLDLSLRPQTTSRESFRHFRKVF